MAWLDPTSVADWLEIPAVDARLQLACSAVEAEVERIRSDLDFSTPPQGNVMQGAIMWAGNIWQAKTAPNGFPQYGEAGGDVYAPIIMGARWVEISRLIGIKRPLAL